MVANPDQSRRKDSLRQFVVTLFERKQFKQLAFFPYIDMFEDLEQIIETRARSVDLSVNNYYDFFYSFHVSKENFRKGTSFTFSTLCQKSYFCPQKGILTIYRKSSTRIF